VRDAMKARLATAVNATPHSVKEALKHLLR